MQSGKQAGIAKVLISGGPVQQESGTLVANAGMGIVVDSRHVLTCAHVVNTAFGLHVGNPSQPEEDCEIRVVFPLSTDNRTKVGRVVAWRRMGDTPVEDVAVIELNGDAPADVGIARFAERPSSD